MSEKVRVMKDKLSPNGWRLLLAVAVGAFLFFTWQYLGLIAGAALAAWLFYPMYARMLKRIKRPTIVAWLTFLISVIVILVPIGFVLALSIFQLSTLATQVAGSFNVEGSGVRAVIEGAINSFNAVAAPFTGGDVLSVQAVNDFIRSTLPEVMQGFIAFLLGTVGNIPLMVIYSIMYIIFFLEFLIHGQRFKNWLKEVSPIGPNNTALYLERMGLMANAMAKGQLLIAFIIAVLSAILLGFLGLWPFFWLMVVVFTLLNLVPLGSGLIIMPIIFIAILAGNVVPGIIVLIAYILVSNLDSVLRPKFIPKSIMLTAGLTMVAAFAGIGFFGLLGVVYGPILMIMIVTALQMYREYRQSL